uniref:dUTPase-like domain-containing protein n=1 Tax=Equus caballus TaxID=9796 RepID=A0A9L0TGQ8_HORSE
MPDCSSTKVDTGLLHGAFIFFQSVPVTLCSAGLEDLVPEGGMLPVGDTTTIPLNSKLRLLPCHFGLLLPLNQQAKKRVMVLTELIDPDYQGEIGLLFHNGGKERTATRKRCISCL